MEVNAALQSCASQIYERAECPKEGKSPRNFGRNCRNACLVPSDSCQGISKKKDISTLHLE